MVVVTENGSTLQTLLLLVLLLVLFLLLLLRLVVIAAAAYATAGVNAFDVAAATVALAIADPPSTAGSQPFGTAHAGPRMTRRAGHPPKPKFQKRQHPPLH